ncbi:MAG TPA: ABC transporter substrate-binding protein [Acidimicrobiia bacterium]|nr:ABC transporter substrate-binding protein [Acidimicrobiia bacterium]
MTRGRIARRFAAMVSAALVTGASLVAAAGAPPAGAASTCPLDALKKAKGTVQITMWHSMPRANEQTLQKLTDQFNSSQSKVKVNLLNQVTYDDTFTKYKSGLSSGDLPDIVQLQDTDQAQMIDTRTVLPAAACAKADNYSFSAFLPRVLSYVSIKGTVYAMPFNTSGSVLFYNKNAFQKAGLDPTQPPTTLDEVRSDAQKLKDSGAVGGAPMGLKVDPGFFEQWLGFANQLFVNNSNGRQARATKAVFDNPTGRELFAWMSGMVKDGLAETNPDSGSSQYDNLLGIGNGNFAMAMDTSASLGTITQVLATGQYPNVSLGVGPMPGPEGKGGVHAQGGELFMVNKSSPAKQAAAWQFLKFLDTSASQVTWAIGTGYIPIVKSAAASPQMKDFWAQNPGYKVAFDQLLDGANTPATAGSVIGAYAAVKDAVRNAENSMFLQGTSPDAAVKKAASDSTAAMADYNQRVPAGAG